MPHTSKAILVIDAADQATENQWIVENVDPSGEATFAAALTADGSTITAYWTGGLWYDDQFAKIQDRFAGRIYFGTPDDVLTQLGLQRFAG